MAYLGDKHEALCSIVVWATRRIRVVVESHASEKFCYLRCSHKGKVMVKEERLIK